MKTRRNARRKRRRQRVFLFRFDRALLAFLESWVDLYVFHEPLINLRD